MFGNLSSKFDPKNEINRIYNSKPMKLSKLRNTMVLVALLVAPGMLHAALTIEIVGAGANQIPVAVAPFRAEDGLAQKITPVIAADLTRSGLFRMVDAGGMVPVPYEPEQVSYPQWSARFSRRSRCRCRPTRRCSGISGN